MMPKKLSYLIISLLFFCNIANGDNSDRLKQIEVARAQNDKQISNYVHTLYTQLTDAQSELQSNTKLIPLLQNQINVLQADDDTINVKYSVMSKKYTKLKTAFVTIGSLFVGALVFLVLLKFNVLLPYGWIAIPVCMVATTTFLIWKL